MKYSNLVPVPWSAPIDTTLSALETSHEGLSESQVKDRLEMYGLNTFQRHETKSAFSLFFKQFASPLIFILMGAAIVTALLGEWIEFVVISFAVLVNVTLGFYREYHAEHTLEKLSSFIKDRSRVIRDGVEQEIDSELLVPGDVIKLSYGNRVPADARLLSVNNARLNESLLTGESDPVEKTIDSVAVTAMVAERTNIVHAGTLVVDGFATAVVVMTGDMTEIGKIAGLVSLTTRAKTPIQHGLERLAWIIFGIVIVIVVGIFILGISRGEPLFEMLILSVAVAVGAVPEALPIALTVILSIGSERIAKKRGIVRTLLAAETLGSTTLIMTDKTGTLTEANMKLVGTYSIDANGNISSHKDADSILSIALTNVDVLIENPDEAIETWTFKGKPFEINIAKAARAAGIDISVLRAKSSISIPFNSSHKFSVATVDGEYTIMGAPDVLLARAVMDEKGYKLVESWITTASAEGKRLIAVGTMPLSKHITIDTAQDVTIVGILAFHDPIRAVVPEAIKKIESLGTRIVMITGDLKGTALAVARELGWNVTEEQVLTGREIQALSDEELRVIIPHKKIFARVTPEDKLRIGALYRTLGETVAMTGDGVNDAPALKAMDIGIALGSGSDVAKSAADIVLLDDNFETISMAIQEGRRILANIRKTFVYLMSNSLDEVFVIGGSLIAGIALPLTALQIIWVNLFTGSLPALAFAYDEDFDHEFSKKRTLKSMFTREVNILTFGIGVLSSVLLFVMYYTLLRLGVDLALTRSLFFVCFASYILAVTFSFRSLHKPLFSYPVFSNKRLNQSIAIATIFLIATMAIPALRGLFGLTTIPLIWGWFIAGWLILNVLLVEAAKYFFRTKRTKR